MTNTDCRTQNWLKATTINVLPYLSNVNLPRQLRLLGILPVLQSKFSISAKE